MSAKPALKAAKSALDKQDYNEAASQARKVLEADGSNYHGHVFLALAEQKRGNLDEAKSQYVAATKVKGSEALAWQGLISLFEELSNANLEEFKSAVVQLCKIYEEADEVTKGQTVVDKFILYAKKTANRSQLKVALEVLLPKSPIFSFLEGRLPPPADTLTKIAEITEAEEKERINKEVGERRTRLGARLAQVTTEVKREVYSQSPLEEIYKEIIDWTRDDEVRRTYEEKLLRRTYDRLKVSRSNEKPLWREKAQELASGMVIIKHPFDLAWVISLEWKDWLTIPEWDMNILEEYVTFFPESGLAKVLRAYFGSPLSPLYVDPAQKNKASDDEEKKVFESLSTDDILALLSDGLEKSSKSQLAHRLAAEYYLFLEEYESAVETARAGLVLLHIQESDIDKRMPKDTDTVNAVLATALIYYQAPRNYPEAEALFNGILDHDSSSTRAMVGLGLIFEEQGQYAKALTLFDRALRQNPENIEIRIETAWCKSLNGDYQSALEDFRSAIDGIKVVDLRSRNLKAKTYYRLGICIWNIDNSPKKRKDRKGAYAQFLGAIQTNPSFAPAYTYLGYYYEDYSKDQKRARQCFQKAFDLSATEIGAAERLTRAFAKKGEWDLVELISKRVIDTGRTKPIPGKFGGISWPYAALGVVYLNEQDFVNSISSFQSALRIDPKDYNLWVGLGESYHNSGRYIAATKAFRQAEALQARDEKSSEKWFVKYMLANVHRELGDYEEAVDGYNDVLKGRPKELGVLLAVIQTMVDMAYARVEDGFYSSAIDAAMQAIEVAKELVEVKPDAFNLWKSIGDACCVFLSVKKRISDFPLAAVYNILTKVDTDDVDFTKLDGIDLKSIPETELSGMEHPLQCNRIVELAILAYKQAIIATSEDRYAQAVGWFNLGRAEFLAHSLIGPAENGTKYSSAAVKCFRKAIELEASNPEFWNALGVVSIFTAPKVAQHSFVRSLHLNSKNARTWTNLGTLYLLNDDLELAGEAFLRGQSTSPEYPGPWIGQGIIALIRKDIYEMQKLFQHALEISDSSWAVPRKFFAISSLDALLTESFMGPSTDPILALKQVLIINPEDIAMAHLHGLMSERVHDFDNALSLMEAVCSKLDAEYEESESAESLARYACATADLARALFSAGDFEQAEEKADTALQLSAADEEQPWCGTEDQKRKCRVSSHLVLALSKYATQNEKDAAMDLENALEETPDDPAVVCLLAQILWASGSVESKQAAKEKLFDFVEKHPQNLDAVTLLGAIGVVEEDEDILSAVLDDLRSLAIQGGMSSRLKSMSKLLSTIASLTSTENSAASAEAAASVYLNPSKSCTWQLLADMTGDQGAAEMALATSLHPEAAAEEGGCEELARALAGVGRLDDDQRAIMVAPWLNQGWNALSKDAQILS